MRAINYDGNGNVMAYHTVLNPDGSTTEHVGMVSLASIVNGTNIDGTTNVNRLVLTCPTCGATANVPIVGGHEEQWFHVFVRRARGQTLAAAILAVIIAIKSQGGTPVVSANTVP